MTGGPVADSEKKTSDQVAPPTETEIDLTKNEKTDKSGKKKKETFPRVSFMKMFTFATPLDTFLIILGTLGAAGHGVVLPLFSLLFGEIIDTFNLPPDQLREKLFDVSLNFFYIGIGSSICTFLQHSCYGISSTRQAQRLREAFLAAVLKQEVGYYDKVSTGALVSHMSSDTVIFEEAISPKFASAIQFLSTFIAGFAMGFSYGWKLTLVVAATGPLIAAAGGFMMYLMATMTTKGQESYAKAGAVASEAFGGMRTISAFCAENIVIKKYYANLRDATKQGVKRGFASGFGIGLTMFIFFGAYALALWYGGELIVADDYTGGDVLTVFFAVIMGAFALGQAGQALETFSKGQGAAYKLFQVIDRPPIIDSSSDAGERPKKVKGTITFKKVDFRYPSRPEAQIMNGFKLKIKAGQTVALVGPSGAGKSSLVGLIQRFYDPEAGAVYLDKKDIKTLNLRWLRSQIGLVSQEPILFAGTIAENIRYGKEDATMEEIHEAAKSSNAHNFITQFPDGYNTFVGEKGAQLSGGQKQRIAIARAIIKNPKILLLDEATSALDNESERVVQQALDRLMKDRTTIVVAHRLSTIRDADVIAVINKGQVAELGKHEELMEKNGLYAELVKLQGGEDPVAERKKQLDRQQSVRNKEGAIASVDVVSTKKKEVIDADKIHKVPLSRLVAMNKPEFIWLALGCIAACVNGVINPVFGILFTELLSDYYLPKDQIQDAIIPWVLGFVGIGVAIMIAQVSQAGLFGLAGEKLIRRIRARTFTAIIRKDIGWFDDEQHNSGLLASRLASDATLISGMVGTRLGLTVANIATIISGLTIAFIAGWKLTLVVLATSPLIVFAGAMEMMTMTKMGTKTEEANEKANQVASEAIQNIRTVAAFTAEDNIYYKYQDKLREPHAINVRKSGISAVLVGLGDGLMFLAYFINFWYGGKLIADGEMTFLEMMKVFMCIMMSAMSIGQSSAFGPDMPKAKLAAAHIFKLIDHVSSIDAFSEAGSKPEATTGLIELKDVVFHYPTRPDVRVLDGLNLRIEPGKVTALVGASGCGKSSTVALIERFYDINEGKITLDGTSISDINIKHLRSQIGIVSQEPILFAGSIADNIRYGKEDATMEEIHEAAKAANAHNFVSEFPDGYNTAVGEKGAQLSGGQKQRIAIARAIIKNPKILLLDEATSALDTESERVVQEALDRVMKGRTTLVIAHRLSTIRHADTIVVINQGKVEEQGNHDSLVELGGTYYKLVSRRQTISVHPK